MVKKHYKEQKNDKNTLIITSNNYEKEIKLRSKNKKTLANLNILFNGRNKAIKLYDDYSSKFFI